MATKIAAAIHELEQRITEGTDTILHRTTNAMEAIDEKVTDKITTIVNRTNNAIITIDEATSTKMSFRASSRLLVGTTCNSY